LTQTNPPAPFAGVPGAPTTVTVGVIETVPFPRAANGGPLPYVFPWVVLLNASPYTIVVSSGATTTQIAAFNSDKVYIYPGGGLQLTFVAVAGAGSPNPGSDSTVYSTFYHDEPPGQYPAYIGPGASIAFSEVAAVVPSATPIASGGTLLLGPFRTEGFAGLSILVDSTVPLLVTISWSDSGGTLLTGERQMVVAANGRLEMSTPHRGVTFYVRYSNLSGGPGAFDSNVTQTAYPFQAWSYIDPVLMSSNVLVPGAGTPVVLDTSAKTYAGPAVLHIWYNVAATFQLDLEYQDATSAWNELQRFTIAANPAPDGFNYPVYVPPNPLRLLAAGTAGSNFPVICTLMADDWRVG